MLPKPDDTTEPATTANDPWLWRAFMALSLLFLITLGWLALWATDGGA